MTPLYYQAKAASFFIRQHLRQEPDLKGIWLLPVGGAGERIEVWKDG
jgi:hypothetical protein